MDDEQIWVLATKYLSKEATEEEIDQLMKILEQDEEAASLFHKMSLIWNQPKNWSSSQSFDAERDKQQLFDRIRAEEKKAAQLPRPQQAFSHFLFKRLAAAIIFIAICATILIWQLRKEPAPANIVWELHENPRGKRTIQTLSDGTVVHLNADSRIKYVKFFHDNKREVFLEGEAYFEVAKNPEKPFLVHTKEISTKVLGTSFNVRAYQNEPDIKVSLLEGKVEISSPDQPGVISKSFLAPEEQYVFHKEDTTYNICKDVDLSKAIAWKENHLIIDNESLEDVVRKLEIWYGVTFEIESPAIKDCRLKANFENEPLNTVLRVLKLALDVTHEYKENKIILSGEGC